MTMKNDRGIESTGVAIILVVVCVLFCVLAWVAGWGFGWVGNAADVAKKEAYPDALLMKYRTFLAEQNTLDEIHNNINITESQMKSLEKQYPNIPRYHWAQDDRESWSDLQMSIVSQKQNFNRIAQKYNTQMRDFSWRFTNIGDLPPGETVVLHREYVPYIDI